MLKKIALVFIAFLFALNCTAQQFPLLHYTTNEGLPSNTIYKVYRDHKGFIWICTDKGLARYNGISFEVFSTADGLPDNEIFFAQEDPQHRLWFATYNGELCFYKDGKFHNADNTPWLKLPMKTSFINNISIEKDSSVTLSFYEKTYAINVDNNTLHFIYINNINNSRYLLHISKLNNAQYKFLFIDHTEIVDTSHKIVKSYKHNYSTFNGKPCQSWDKAIAQDQRYFFNEHFIYNQDMKVMKTSDFDWKANLHIYSIYFNNKKNYFVGTDKGLFINTQYQILPNDKITGITQDVAKNYWLGTLKNGLYVLSENYPNSYVHNDAYTGNINYTYADNTNLFFVNSNNHIYRLQKNSINTLYKLPTDTTNPTTNLGHVILSHSNKSYSYLNIYNKSLTLVSDLLGKPQKTEKSVPEIETELMKSILNTKDRVYARTVNKIIDLSIDTGCKKCDNIKIHKIFENKERIFGFAKNKEDIWYSTVNGMYKIVKDSEQIASQFSKKNIAFKRFDFLKNGLVGYTYGNKLLVCTSFDSNLTVDTVKYQNCIWDKFYKIDNSHLLISTNDLYRIFTFNDTGNKPNFEITTLENQFIPLQAETIICDSNNCYFFKNGTVYRFTKQELIQKVHPPQIYFTTIAYGGKLRPIHNAMLMSYNSSKNITISFIASSFYGKNISYQFALTKNNAEVWQDLKGEEINLINPGYGAYKLKIRAKTASSGYCAPIEFAFTINKPFWAKWWFIALSILAVFILIFFGVRYRIYLELKKSEKEHEDKIRFLRSEYKALNALMNPHFIFNTLNNVQGLVNRNDKVAANEYLRIFADLVRQNMHNVSKELIPLQKEIELITNYLALEKLRFKELLNYAIEVDEDVDDGVIMVPPLIIQPLIENSIKHGILPMQSVNSRIDVLIYEKEDKLFIQVKDNGIGFNAGGQKKDPKHESYGLGNIKSRLHQLSIIMGKQIDFYFSEEVVNNVKWTVATITIAY